MSRASRFAVVLVVLVFVKHSVSEFGDAIEGCLELTLPEVKQYSGKASAQSVKETFTCLLEARYDPCEVLGTALLSYPHLQRRIKLEIARQCHFNEQPNTGDAVMSGEGEESAEESNNRDADRSKGTP
ncbi:hypothetical protein GBAR_LOCUS16261, partial [Geodia barretti]